MTNEKALVAQFEAAQDAVREAEKAVEAHFRPLLAAAIAEGEAAAWKVFDRVPSCVTKAFFADWMRESGFKRTR